MGNGESSSSRPSTSRTTPSKTSGAATSIASTQDDVSVGGDEEEEEIVPTGVFEGSNPSSALAPTTATTSLSFGQALNEKLILPLGKLLTEKKKKEDVAVRLQEKLRRAEEEDEEEEEVGKTDEGVPKTGEIGAALHWPTAYDHCGFSKKLILY